MSFIQNPILRGFNPDPSIIRVEDDYYIATSTFEWFPGVQIHHSTDLKNWSLISHPLERMSQLNMIGNPDSGGVWAPCLSYSNGTFYLIYTDVKSHMGQFKDTHNYLVTATDICGPWSDPIYLNSSGFDPSMFHDADGTKWILNLKWDHRKGKNPFGGIIIQQYDEEQQKLVGDIHCIYKGTSLGLTEGPHIYQQNGYYYLLVAEGGTRFGHAETVARSRTLLGQYETDPNGPIITSRDKEQLPLQKAGHASLVETQQGQWYMVHLCGRPLKPSNSCTLGRETAIQPVEWNEEQWLQLSHGHNGPELLVPAPEGLAGSEAATQSEWVEHFDGPELSIHFSTLREPRNEAWASLQARSGHLRLVGRESLYSQHRQSLVARRQQAFQFDAETVLEFAPDSYQQLAGLIYYYNTKNYFYLFVSWDEDKGKCVGIMQSDRGVYDEPVDEPISIEGAEKCYLKASVDGEKLQFYFSTVAGEWTAIGPILDASKISDENAELVKDGIALDQGFTGAFVGICAQDLGGAAKHADFDYFIYRERD